MMFYCEKVLYNSKKNICEVILDFESADDVRIFGIELLRFTPEKKQSIIVLKNLSYISRKGFRRGEWYDFPLNFFNNFLEESVTERNSRILTKYEHNEDKPLNIQKFKVKRNHVQDFSGVNINKNWGKMKEFLVYFSFTEDTELIVKNVGCGNWNEVKTGEKTLIYDLGGDILSSDQEMRSIIKSSSVKNEYICVISHWDLDHYKAILDLTLEELQNMKCIIVPTLTPNTHQYKETMDRLVENKIPIFRIHPTQKTQKHRITLKRIQKVERVIFYRSSDGSKINQSGIVLVISGNDKNAILTGDHHYLQLKNSVFNDLNPEKKIVFIVPHHGGSAGNFARYKNMFPSNMEGALSTKINRYDNVPIQEIHNFFVKINNFHCTDCRKKEYITKL